MGALIWKAGTYKTVNDNVSRQRFLCVEGGHTFSETSFSDLFGKHGSYKEYEQCCKMLNYNMSTDAIADILDKDVRTVNVWIEAVSKKAKKIHFFRWLLSLSKYELWTYIKNKGKKLWVFTGIDAQSKFWLHFELGSRTKNTANKIVKRCKDMLKLTGRKIKITTDKLSAYNDAIKQWFKGHCSYLQMVTELVEVLLNVVTRK